MSQHSRRSVRLLLVVCFIALAGLLNGATAFSIGLPDTSGASSTRTTRLHGFLDAFKNDESLGPVKNEGLKNGPKYNENVTVNGMAVQGAVVGQKLTVVAGRARVKIPVNCQKGDCGTCMVLLNGRKVKACQAILPSGKAAIKTL
jgi:ferredoxin